MSPAASARLHLASAAPRRHAQALRGLLLLAASAALLPRAERREQALAAETLQAA
jgi:hypothetical protein